MFVAVTLPSVGLLLDVLTVSEFLSLSEQEIKWDLCTWCQIHFLEFINLACSEQDELYRLAHIFLFASVQLSCRLQYNPTVSELLCPSMNSK